MSAQQLSGIVTPHEHDVLSGRGNFVNYHVGNEHFRALVRKHKLAYVACPKPQKGKFSKMIVDEIRERNPPGRFLKQDPRTKLWFDIGEKKALDKTRQALREGAPDILKEMSGENETADDSGDDGGETSSPATTPPPTTSSQTMSSSGDGVKNLLVGGNANALGGNMSSIGINAGYNMDGVYNNNFPSASLISTLGNGLSTSHHGVQGLNTTHHGVQGLNTSHHGGQLNTSQHGGQSVGQGLNTSHHGGQGLSTSRHGGQGLNTSQHGGQSLSTSQHGGMSTSQHSSLSTSQHSLTPTQQGNLTSHNILNGLMNFQPQAVSSSNSTATLLSSQGMHSGTTLNPGMSFQQQLAQYGLQQQSMLPPGSRSSNQNTQFSLLSTPSAVSANLLGGSSFGPIREVGSNQFSADQLDPRPIDPRLPMQSDERYKNALEFERVAPLPPPRKVPVKLKREGSEHSLKMDTIFKGEQDTSEKRKMSGSSAALSIMSLSLGDVTGSVSDHTPIDLGSSEEVPIVSVQSAPIPSAAASMRPSGDSRNARLPGPLTQPQRRYYGGQEQLNQEYQNSVMDMSQVTLGDRLSDIGDASLVRLSESQVNMSFSNVFEDIEREIMNQR